MRKTLSSYSRVLCSLQCNSKSRGELEKAVVGFIKGLADETVLGSQQRPFPNLPAEYNVISSLVHQTLEQEDCAAGATCH